MSATEVELRCDGAAGDFAVAPVPEPPAPSTPEPPRFRILPVLITLAAVRLAALLGWAMWEAYRGAPWTRDGSVRAYVVTMAPEIQGRIVELPVADNQLVHMGDLLLVIDPTNYRIAVSLGEAAVQQAQADAQNAASEASRRQHIATGAVSVEELVAGMTATVQIDPRSPPAK